MSHSALKYIETILEVGSITAAAKKLYVAQPSLSQYIRRIESENEIELFDRTKQPWRLTEDGQFYLECERKIHALNRERSQFFNDRRELKKGDLVIGSTQYRSQTLLTKILPVFRSRYPNICVHISEGTTQDVLEFTENGLVDCGLVVESFVTNKLEKEFLIAERPLIVTPKKHKAVKTIAPVGEAKFPMVRFSQFKNDDFVILKRGQMFNEFFRILCNKYGIEPNVVMETQSVTTIPDFVANGVGCALVPDPIADKTDPRVSYYDLGLDLPINNLMIAWSKTRYLAKSTLAFINTAKEVLRQ